MRVLVTGGGGYIGGVAVELLNRRGDDVVVLDNFWRGHRASIAAGTRMLDADLRDKDATLRALTEARPEAVLHFAAATLVPESMRDPGLYYANNVVGSHHLMEAMRSTGVEKLVFSSTAAVYGVPEQLPLAESAPKRPINPYGISKYMVEQMIESYGAAYGLRHASLRYFNVAGATQEHGEQHDPETHVIPVMLQTLRGEQERFAVYGNDYPTPDGTAVRDYVHVEDLVDAHLLALAALDRGIGGPFNLGTREGFSVNQLIDAVQRVTGQTLPVDVAPRREGDPPALIAESRRAREVLGWTPERSTLDQMIGSAWAWFTQAEQAAP